MVMFGFDGSRRGLRKLELYFRRLTTVRCVESSLPVIGLPYRMIVVSRAAAAMQYMRYAVFLRQHSNGLKRKSHGQGVQRYVSLYADVSLNCWNGRHDAVVK